MALILSRNFNEEPLNSSPEGWYVTPSGSAVIAPDPQLAHSRGNVVRMHDDSQSSFCECDFSVTDARLRFYMNKMVNNAGVFEASVHDSKPQRVGYLYMQNDGLIYVLTGYSGALMPVANYEAGRWYLFEWSFHKDKTFDLSIDGVLAVENAMWENNDVTAGQVAALKFGASPGQTGFFDDVAISCFDAEPEAPARIALASDFEGDAGSALLSTMRPDDTSPDEFNSYYPAENVRTDSINKTWRTSDASDGFHRLTWNYTASNPVTRRLDMIAILGHNLASVKSGILRISLKAKNNPGQAWHTPDLEVDLTGKMEDPVILAWIPGASSYAYWQLCMYAMGAADVDFFEIGRVVLTSLFVPSHNYNQEYTLARTDPSDMVKTEGGARISRVKPAYRTASIKFRDMSIEDQETLDGLFNRGGAHSPWFAALDPRNHPIDRSVYGNLDSKLTMDRTALDYGDVALKIEEIVS